MVQVVIVDYIEVVVHILGPEGSCVTIQCKSTYLNYYNPPIHCKYHIHQLRHQISASSACSRHRIQGPSHVCCCAGDVTFDAWREQDHNRTRTRKGNNFALKK